MLSNHPTEENVNQLISESVAKSAALSALPIPIIDAVGVVLVQIQMVERLADQFEVKVDNREKLILSSLIVTVVTKFIAVIISSLLEDTRFQQMVGESVIKASLVTLSTTALGEVYARHFRKGGQIDDLTLDDVIDYIQEQIASDRMSLDTLGSRLVDQLVDQVS